MPIKIFRAGMVFGLYLIMTSSAAYAADAQILYTQSLPATFPNCPGPQGKSIKAGPYTTPTPPTALTGGSSGVRDRIQKQKTTRKHRK